MPQLSKRGSIVDKIRNSKGGKPTGKKDAAKNDESRRSLVSAGSGNKIDIEAPPPKATSKKAGANPDLPVCPKERHRLEELQEWKAWGPCKKFANSQYFETTCVIAIIAFAGVVGAEVEYTARNPDENYTVFILINNGFNVWFGFELLCRMLAADRPCCVKFFWSKDWMWNWFDFIMVCSFLFELTAEIGYNAGKEVKLFINSIKVFRIIRIVRILRILRMLKDVEEIKKMVGMIHFSSKMLIWTMIILFALHYIFAVVFVRAYVDYTQLDDSLDADAVAALKTNFGNLEKSLYSLFKSITGGQSWNELSDPLLKIHWIYGAAFMFFVSFTLWTVFNILTGIFVDASTQIVKKDEAFACRQEEETKERYEAAALELFRDIDKDGSGFIDKEEFEESLKDPRMEAFLEVLEIDSETGKTLFELLDHDHAGEISTKAFIAGCKRMKHSAKGFDMQTLMHQQGKIVSQMKAMEILVESKLTDIMQGVGEGGISEMKDKNDDTREAVQRRLKRLFLVATTPQLLKCESDLQDAIEKAYNDKKAWKQDQLGNSNASSKKPKPQESKDDGTGSKGMRSARGRRPS